MFFDPSPPSPLPTKGRGGIEGDFRPEAENFKAIGRWPARGARYGPEVHGTCRENPALRCMAPVAKIPEKLLVSTSFGVTPGTVPAGTAAGVQQRRFAER